MASFSVGNMYPTDSINYMIYLDKFQTPLAPYLRIAYPTLKTASKPLGQPALQ